MRYEFLLCGHEILRLAKQTILGLSANISLGGARGESNCFSVPTSLKFDRKLFRFDIIVSLLDMNGSY
jgi:hypothetical protein